MDTLQLDTMEPMIRGTLSGKTLEPVSTNYHLGRRVHPQKASAIMAEDNTAKFGQCNHSNTKTGNIESLAMATQTAAAAALMLASMILTEQVLNFFTKLSKGGSGSSGSGLPREGSELPPHREGGPLAEGKLLATMHWQSLSLSQMLHSFCFYFLLSASCDCEIPHMISATFIP